MATNSTGRGFGKMNAEDLRRKEKNIKLMQDIEQIDLHVTGMENDRTAEAMYGNG